MANKTKSIRPFIGAKDYELSRSFYRDMGFEEVILSNNLSYFNTEGIGFYLQDANVRDWIDNTMVFLEVADVARYYDELSALGLPLKYKDVRLSQIVVKDWGRECFLHDPSGILWHIGEFF